MAPETLASRHENEAYAFALKRNDWDDYHHHRPAYPQSMWDTWFAYHGNHGGVFDSAHDIGAGPGTAAKVLGTCFTHTYVSDAGQANITSASKYLLPPSSFTLHHSPAENPWLPAQSIDFASICMALHYMDADVVLQNVARTLKPGGTLAVCTYSFMLKFPGRRELEGCWFGSLSEEVGRFVREGRLFPAAIKGMCRAMSGLNSVSIPSELFSDVTRLQVNISESDKDPFCFANQDEQVQLLPSQIKQDEKVEYVQDEGWRREVDVEWLKGFLVSCHLGFGEETWKLESWRELERVVEGDGGKVVIEWPVAMILATRGS
ncbi:Fc.00g057690.m01.CDS01 [Cosmosporella sp. VM-42]